MHTRGFSSQEDPFERNFLLPRRNLTDIRSQDGEATPRRKDIVKLEFEPWPKIAQFKNWKAAFRREVITDVTHPRQVTEWLAEIDHTNKMPDVDDTASIFRQHSYEHRHRGLQDCERSRAVAEELEETNGLPMLTEDR